MPQAAAWWKRCTLTCGRGVKAGSRSAGTNSISKRKAFHHSLSNHVAQSGEPIASHHPPPTRPASSNWEDWNSSFPHSANHSRLETQTDMHTRTRAHIYMRVRAHIHIHAHTLIDWFNEFLFFMVLQCRWKHQDSEEKCIFSADYKSVSTTTLDNTG